MLGTVNHSAPNLPILAVNSVSQSGSNGQQSTSASMSGSSQSPTSLQADNCSAPHPTVVAASQTRQLLNNSNLKLMQRLLDEASQTGELILTGRNLTEFPSKLAIVYDLSDTIFAGIYFFLLLLLLDWNENKKDKVYNQIFCNYFGNRLIVGRDNTLLGHREI